MKVILIDDEHHMLENLSIMLEESHPEVEIVGTATSALEGLKLIRRHGADVVFLDISMPNGSGFDFLDAVGTIDFHVVFVTAHEQFAIDALKRHAFDYILKPIEKKELNECLVKLLKLRHQPEKNAILSIHSTESIEFVEIEEIVYCRSENSYCHLYTSKGGHHFFSKQLKTLQTQLPETEFVRCHNSYIVNRHFIKRYVKSDSALELTTGEFIPIARSRREQVLRWMAQY